MGRRLGLAQRRADHRLLLGRGDAPRPTRTRLSRLMLIRLFQQTPIYWGQSSQVGKIDATPYLLIGRGLVPGSETEQGLERGHGLPAAIMAKDEFIKISLELIAAYAVIGSEQPLLQVANGAVRQRHHGLRAFVQIDSERLTAGHMLKSSFLQSGEALEAVGVYRGTRCHVLFKETEEGRTLKSGMTAMRARPVARPRFSTATKTRAALRPCSCRLPRKPAWVPPIQVSSTSTSPRSGSRAKLTMACRNLCSIIQAVSYRRRPSWRCKRSAETPRLSVVIR